MILGFDDWEIDTELCELRHDGLPRVIEPRVFDLLLFLVRNRDHVVSKTELIDSVWNGRIVSETAISTCIKAARQAIGDDGEAQRLIRTIRGRGFRFAGQVESKGTGDGSGVQDAGPMHASVLSLAVLPFEVFSGDARLEFFADGLVEDLTTMLASIPGLTVISRSSSFAYKGRHPGAHEVRRDLGVSHVIEGSVRTIDDSVRINVQLVSTADQRHLWAERFDRSPADATGSPDEIIRAIGRRIEPELVRAAYLRSQQQDWDRDALLAYQRASGLLALKGWHPGTFSEAAATLRRSLEIEPRFARAHAHLALILALGHRIGLLGGETQAAHEALHAAEHALELDDLDATVLGYAGCALAELGEFRRGIPIIERAVEHDPSNAQAWAALGAAKLMAGRAQEAVEHLSRGIRLSPLDNRLAVWGSSLAFALMMTGDLEAAVSEAETACRRDFRNHIPWVVLAAVLLAARRIEDARSALEEAVRARPGLDEAMIESLVGRRSLQAMRDARLLEGGPVGGGASG